MPFRLVPKSTTLDDLERSIHILFHKRCIFRSTPQKWMKIDPHYRGKNVGHWLYYSFWRHKVCADIRRGSLVRGRQTTVGSSKTLIFMGFGRYVFGTLGHEANIIIQYYFVPCRLSSDPKTLWPWMTLTGYLALNSVFAPVWLTETARLRNSENNCVKTNEDRHILSVVQIFGRDSSFWWYKVCADIRSGSLETRR